MSAAAEGLLQSRLQTLPLVGRGKVRDIYAVGDSHLLIVQTDRISAFDVVMEQPVPGKGAVLTAMSFFWFEQLAGMVKNHLSGKPPESAVGDNEKSQVAGRAMLVKKYRPLPIEAVCRGYLIGSGWKDYRATGKVCGIPLPSGLQLAAKLPEVIFTPATKAEAGEHDENISYEQMADIVGAETAEKIRETTLSVYARAAGHAAERGIIIADTKLEFALDDDGELVLIDEVFTPDSSRFWPADSWSPGKNPESFDKQIVRDWLETQAWDKSPPPPVIPDEVLRKTADRYLSIQQRLLGE